MKQQERGQCLGASFLFIFHSSLPPRRFLLHRRVVSNTRDSVQMDSLLRCGLLDAPPPTGKTSLVEVSPEISGKRILPRRRKGWEKSPVEGKSFCLQPALSALSTDHQHTHPGSQFSWEVHPRSLC